MSARRVLPGAPRASRSITKAGPDGVRRGFGLACGQRAAGRCGRQDRSHRGALAGAWRHASAPRTPRSRRGHHRSRGDARRRRRLPGRPGGGPRSGAAVRAGRLGVDGVSARRCDRQRPGRTGAFAGRARPRALGGVEACRRADRADDRSRRDADHQPLRKGGRGRQLQGRLRLSPDARLRRRDRRGAGRRAAPRQRRREHRRRPDRRGRAGARADPRRAHRADRAGAPRRQRRRNARADRLGAGRQDRLLGRL